jgi:lipopolysaccharide export LptBFGC system permease protein LptF
MKLYWSYNSIPELADLSNEKRNEIWKTCYATNWKVRFLSSLIMPVFMFVGILIALSYFRHTLVGMIIAVVITSIGWYIGWQITVNMIRPYLRKYLKSNVKTN